MATRVFGPHVTGLNVLGTHIGATVEVFRDGSNPVPGSLTVHLSPPVGSGVDIKPVENGKSGTVKVINDPELDVEAIINNCRTQPAAGGAPALFIFQVTLRAHGKVKVALIPVPVSVQIDAFDVHIPT